MNRHADDAAPSRGEDGVQPSRKPLRRLAAVLVCLVALAGCAALDPKQLSMAERLEAIPRDRLPLEKPVTIRWNQYQVPFVEAD